MSPGLKIGVVCFLSPVKIIVLYACLGGWEYEYAH